MLFKGRGAQINPKNPFLNLHIERNTPEKTQFIFIEPQTIVHKIDSPDVGAVYSLNPYLGCEHGCAYCYARNSHTYWGFSAGIDFETKILIKRNAPYLLEKTLQNPKWQVAPIMLSGNTDCYQPAEKRFQITRKLLQVLWRYRHPVGIITKNALILRDLDILRGLAKHRLVRVYITLTTLNEGLRQKLEPRTVTPKRRLKTIEALSKEGIPVVAMIAPIIPGLNDHEIPLLLKAAADVGALSATYTIVRLNGQIAEIFCDWLKKAYPMKAQKVLNRIRQCHDGKLNDSRWFLRLRGTGVLAQQIEQLFTIFKERYFKGRTLPPWNLESFHNPLFA